MPSNLPPTSRFGLPCIMIQNSISAKYLPVITSGFAVVLGIWVKLSLTNGALLPGLDGAYYWVQVQSILKNFSLAFSDLPLIFWIQAILAWIIGDVQLAVRISDAVFPALSAIPIYLIARQFKNPFLPSIAILVVLLNPIQLYFFTGDFIKNESAIPAVFFICWVLMNWENKSKLFSIISLSSATLFIAFSHFGTLLLTFILLSIWGLFQLRGRSIKFWIQGTGFSAIGIIGLLLFLRLLVPTRFTRLVDFLTSPNDVFIRPAFDAIRYGYANPIMARTIIIGQSAALIFALIFWISRANFTYSHFSMTATCLIATFTLSSPIFGLAWSDRLVGLSFVPLSIAAILIFGSVQIPWKQVLVAGFAVVTLFSAIQLNGVQTKYVFSEQQYGDFKKMVTEVDIPKNSVIVARHGVEYLSAWHFKTDVVLDSYYPSADLSQYSSVFYIQEWNAGSSGKGKPDKDKPPLSGTTNKPEEPGLGGKSPKPLGKGDAPINSSKGQNPEGVTIYANTSFALIKIR